MAEIEKERFERRVCGDGEVQHAVTTRMREVTIAESVQQVAGMREAAGSGA